MPYLLYNGRTAQTGRNLVEVLGIFGGTQAPERRQDILIRWGSSLGVPYRPERTINSKRAIELATNKRVALLVMSQAHVPTPQVFLPGGMVQTPCLARHDNHFQGTDIQLCLQQKDVVAARGAGATHFTALVPKSREFRVHVFRNEILKISEKVLQNQAFYKPWVWNRSTGFVFLNPRPMLERVTAAIHNTSIAAVQALGLDFGAVDLCITDDGAIRVFEVNTGPSLSDRSLSTYARRLATELQVQINEDQLRRLEELVEVADEEN